MITAIVLIKADVARIPEVAQHVADVPGVTEVYSVTGGVDLIAMVRVTAYEHLRLLLKRCGTVCRRGRDGLGRRPQGLDRQPWILTGS